MKRVLTETELAFILAALDIARQHYAADAKNMGAQAGTLEAPLSATYKRMADEFTQLAADATTLRDALYGDAVEVTVEKGDPDGL